MAKSKKPRKKYRQRFIADPKRNYFAQSEIKEIFDFLSKLELQIQLSLPLGYLDDDGFDTLASFVNWGCVIRNNPNRKVPSDINLAIHELQTDAVFALEGIKKRVLAGKTDKLVATGDELKVIRDYSDTMIPFFRECVLNTPQQTFNEIWVATTITGEVDTVKNKGAVEITSEKIKAILDPSKGIVFSKG